MSDTKEILDFHVDGCKHNQIWRSQNTKREGHWHRMVLGKELCGADTSGYCWEGDHSGRCEYEPCGCLCHPRNTDSVLLSVREALKI